MTLSNGRENLQPYRDTNVSVLLEMKQNDNEEHTVRLHYITSDTVPRHMWKHKPVKVIYKLIKV